MKQGYQPEPSDEQPTIPTTGSAVQPPAKFDAWWEHEYDSGRKPNQMPGGNTLPSEAARYMREAEAVRAGQGLVRMDATAKVDNGTITNQSDPRTEIAIGLWHKWADVSHIEWKDESHKAEYLMAVDDITNSQLLELLLSRLNFDGSEADTNSLTVGEIRRAI